jgi:MoaA/NifB/PqqE/SkfB family radical SAM enzyme
VQIKNLERQASTMNKSASKFDVFKTLLSNPRLIRVKPAVNWFLLQYMNKFKVKKIGDQLVLHSHLPPLNSKAFKRFINEHLLVKTGGPSHAQVGVTNACPQNCEYCYNQSRHGKVMDKQTIKKVIRDLKKLGVFWLGFTGGEPLLNKDLVEITESAGEDCTLKLFTTGCTLTRQQAFDLKQAGLLYVSVSLDHWDQARHDSVRRYKGAFQTALKAIDIFKSIGGMHVSVSAVLSREMLQGDRLEEFLSFLNRLEIDEAWLSETKPAIAEFWNKDLVIGEDERLMLINLQDRYNKQGGMTINYLGHFESEHNFGCTAGHKMIYVDAFGEVTPCVFMPMSFGNVHNSDLADIFLKMRSRFPAENRCFVNTNYGLLQKYGRGKSLLDLADNLSLLSEVQFNPLSRFFQLHYH